MAARKRKKKKLSAGPLAASVKKAKRWGRPPLEFELDARMDLRVDGIKKRQAIANLHLGQFPDMATFLRWCVDQLAAGKVPHFADAIHERQDL